MAVSPIVNRRLAPLSDLLPHVDPLWQSEAALALERWWTVPEQWHLAVQTLYELKSLQQFVTTADSGYSPLGISGDLARELVRAAYDWVMPEIRKQWKFLARAPITVSHLLPLFRSLDTWDAVMSNKIGRIRQNPYLLMQIDRAFLQNLYPRLTAEIDLRQAWMGYLDCVWPKAPDRLGDLPKDAMNPAERNAELDRRQQRYRQFAAGVALLQKTFGDGHTYCYTLHRPHPDRAAENLNFIRKMLANHRLDDETIREILRELSQLSRDTSPNQPHVWIPRQYQIHIDKDHQQYESVESVWYFRGELNLSRDIPARLIRPRYPWPTWGDAVLDAGYTDPLTGKNFPFDESQRRAIRALYTAPFSILAAPPGTGKTTIIWALHELYRRETMAPGAFMVTSPFGRSARVAAQRVPTLSQKPLTLHSFVASVRAQTPSDNKKLEGAFADALGDGFLIVDEAFAADAGILGAASYCAGRGGRMIWIGDPDQVRPVSGGLPALDVFLMLRRAVEQHGIDPNPIQTLTINHRSVAVLPDNARAIQDDPAIDPQTGDPKLDPVTQKSERLTFQWDATHCPRIAVPDALTHPERLTAEVQRWVAQWERQRPANVSSLTAWHVIAYTNREVALLNFILRQILQPQAQGPWVVGERIMQIHNDYTIGQYGLRNGEFGDIIAMTRQSLTARFSDQEVTVPLVYAESYWRWAYATTVHKALGGEWEHVAFVHLPPDWVKEQLNQVADAPQATVAMPIDPDAADHENEEKEDEEWEDTEREGAESRDHESDPVSLAPDDSMAASYNTSDRLLAPSDGYRAQPFKPIHRPVVYTALTRAQRVVVIIAPDPQQIIEGVTRAAHKPRYPRYGRRTQLRGFLRKPLAALKDRLRPHGQGGGEDTM